MRPKTQLRISKSGSPWQRKGKKKKVWMNLTSITLLLVSDILDISLYHSQPVSTTHRA